MPISLAAARARGGGAGGATQSIGILELTTTKLATHDQLAAESVIFPVARENVDTDGLQGTTWLPRSAIPIYMQMHKTRIYAHGS